MNGREERIGLNGAAAILDASPDEVRKLVEEGRLGAESNGPEGYSFVLSEVIGLAGEVGSAAEEGLGSSVFGEDEVFEGEVMGEESPAASRLPEASTVSSLSG